LEVLMWKKLLLATIVLFVAFGIMDFVLHSLILMGVYSETKELWRPMAEMKMWVQYVAKIISIFSFVFIYSKLITNKSLKNSIIFGTFWGIAAGMSMGYETYAVMPIPYILAISWFWGSFIEWAVAGLIAGMIIKD
jgi:hypothetical protein